MNTEAALPPRQLLETLIDRLHVIASDTRTALVELPVELLDALAVFGAEREDDEDGGDDEDNADREDGGDDEPATWECG